ncbi:MAG TPA: T9SS type A sorting domain-containing protein [Ignavibacteria bacterium]|nr:T9SS type A sorting domain-containing protein [Ignavibacteria bacterium]
MPESTRVKLSVYDALGRRVAVLIDADMPADRHTYTWDASGFASGLYFYRFETPKYSVAKKMILVK